MYYRGSQDEPLLYVSPFRWGLWRDGDDASLRHVRCDEYSIESNGGEIEDEND
jgi:hypothetical protein